MADRIQTEIDRIDKSITNLIGKIQKLQQELSSGHYGTDQLAKMQSQLNTLNATLEKRQTKKLQLVDQQSIRELNSLNKSIETLQQRIAIGKGALGLFKTDDPQHAKLMKQIKDSERALASLESRRLKRFSPVTGYRKTVAEMAAEQERINVELEDRLAKQQSEKASKGLTQLPSAGVGGKPTTVREQVDLEGRLSKILGEQNVHRQQAVRLEKELVSHEKDALEEALRRLETGGFQEGDTPHRPGVFDPSKMSPEELAQVNKVNADANRKQNELLRESILQKSRAVTNNEKYIQQLEQETKTADRNAEKKRKLAEEEKRLADARARVSSDPRYRQALEQARARGFDVDSLKGIEDRGGNVQRLRFSQTSGGINQQFNPYVNMLSGSSTPGLSSQFRTFGSDIARDIGQFTKWSIAVAAVYTPLAKLSELLAIMVDNESRLADATIAANVPFEKSDEIFAAVAVSANQAGESINTTIDAYTQAIRAAGRYGTQEERAAQATTLLNDSLILSKLSALDQAAAIDTLSAALLQSDRELNEGQELLNKWVRVSQVANVSIDTLATGVAVLGDAAETSGLSIDQLNGLIAVLAEQSISGSKEAANVAKALVGAYQSDKAEATLNRYGIALRRANGEVRGFLEIYQELAQLRQEGVLSESAVSEVALALGGGGVRRAKDASALINSTERLNQLAEESAKVTGEDTLANDALAKKLETVQTANTRLANSFQEIAQTLGDDGGLLDGFKSLIDLLTTTVKFTNELFSILGRSGPILATFVTGLAAMNAYYGVGGRREVALERLGATGQFSGFLGLGNDQFSAQYRGSRQTGGGPLADVLRMNTRGGMILGGAGVAAQGISNLASGRNQQAIANVVGGIVGGVAGSLGGPVGIAIGANIGSAIGDAFVTGVSQHSDELADFFAPKLTPDQRRAEEEAARTEAPTGQETTADLLNKAYDSLTFGQQLLAAARANPQNLNLTGAATYQTKESAALDILKGVNPGLYQELYSRFIQLQKEEAIKAAQAAASASVTDGGEYAGLRQELEGQAASSRRQQLDRLARGEITTSEFGRISEQLAGFPSAAIKSVTDFDNALIGITDEIGNTTEAYDAFLYIATYGTQDQINLINQYSDDIRTLRGYIDEWQPELKGLNLELTFGDVKIQSKEQLEKLLGDLQLQGATALGNTLQQVQAAQSQSVKLPALVGDYNKPLTGGQQDAIVQKGLEIQEKFLIETGKSAEEMARFKAGLEAFYVSVERGSSVMFEATEGLAQQFYDLGKEALEAAGELSELEGFGLQKFDVDRATLESLAQQSIALGQGWAQQFPGFETKPEDLLAITNDGLVQPIHADFRILALLLEKIVDQNQKQLDGQYNIPEGATFWVPLTAAYYRRNAGGDNSLQSMLDSLAVDSNTSATDENTRALQELTQKYLTSDHKLREQQGIPYQAKTAYDMQREHFMREYRDDANPLAAAARRRVAVYEATSDARQDGSGFSPSAQQQAAESKTFFQQLKEILLNLILGIGSVGAGQGLGSAGANLGGNNVGGGNNGSIGSRAMTTSAPTTPTTKLDLRVSSNINLLVDGRILASTLQNYLASELLRTEQSQGLITKRYVI